MKVDRPAPGEELNTGSEPTVPRQAATVLVLRGGAGSLEVLLVKRNPAQRFMGGAWVFPGGAVDATEGEGDDAHRAAGSGSRSEASSSASRIAAALVKFSRWITPAEVAIRFDTHFFLAELPEGQEPEADGDECVDLGWFTPDGALDAHERGDIVLVFPTIKTLEQLAAFDSAARLIDWAAGREVVPVQPKVVQEGEVARIVLPGEPGYENH
jgi:8-oxo-dGTP pyrophosphatase MutT (NUDIX family)